MDYLITFIQYLIDGPHYWSKFSRYLYVFTWPISAVIRWSLVVSFMLFFLTLAIVVSVFEILFSLVKDIPSLIVERIQKSKEILKGKTK